MKQEIIAMNKTGWIVLIVCLGLLACIAFGVLLGRSMTFDLSVDQDAVDTKSYKDLKNPYAADGVYSVKAEGLKELNVDWISGSVIVELTDTNVILIQETSDKTISEKDALRYGVSGGKLRIQACKKNHPGKLPRKDLVISLPRSLADELLECRIDTVSASASAAGLRLDALAVNTVSGTVMLSDMIAEEVEIDTVSGPVALLDSTAESLRVDSVSGKINVAGHMKKVKSSSVSGPMECDLDSCRDIRANTVSGNVSLVLRETPEALKIGTTSGEVRIALPTDASCTIHLDAMSGKLYLNDDAVGAKQLTLGEGSSAFDIDSMSGNVYIRTK